jgi:outer membrane protein OmpA-like peptidoglycan-associated protein
VPDSEDGCPDVSGIDLGCPADADGDGLPDAEDACPDLAEDSDGFDDDDGCPELDNDNDGFEDTEDRCPDEGGLDEGCPLEVSLTLYFETDSSELSSEAREALEHWASSLMSASVEPAMFSAATLTIVGHTDATGEAAYNEQLSRQRALSVASVLRELGFDIETVDSTGVGAAEPAAMGSDERSLSRNRRVELQLSLPTVDAVPETP